MEILKGAWAELELYWKILSFFAALAGGAILGFLTVKKVKIPELEKRITANDKRIEVVCIRWPDLELCCRWYDSCSTIKFYS